MDEKLRKLYRAIVDDETAARYVAESVRLGENTRERVIQAARLAHPAAVLLEGEHLMRGATFEELETGARLLSEDEKTQAYKDLQLVEVPELAWRGRLIGAMGHERARLGEGDHYVRSINKQLQIISKLLLKL